MHDHSHCDHHGPANYNWAFALGTLLNLAFVVGEIIYGVANHALSLLADAGHNFGDVLGLLMGWFATVLATRPATARRTYGYRRSTILAAFSNAALLLIGVGAIALEAICRIGEPVVVPGTVVMVVAGVGIVINGGTALAFMRGRKDDLNLEGAYTHMLSDAVVAFGVVIGGLVMRSTGIAWIDPLMGLLIALIVAVGSWRLLRRSLDMAIDAVPEGVDPIAIRSYLTSLPGVEEVTDLHIWSISTTVTALTAHLVLGGATDPDFAAQIALDLHEQFDIDHSTIQLDASGKPCSLSV